MRRSLQSIGLVSAIALISGLLAHEQRALVPAPTYQDVAYGLHERNTLDFWKAESADPTPLIIVIHGGGFISGSKDFATETRHGLGASLSNVETLQQLLSSGISVAAINYRLLSAAPQPAPFEDGLRAIQFLRSKASEWNIDKSRLGALGESAGAMIAMWLAFHDEMADPNATDPADRE